MTWFFDSLGAASFEAALRTVRRVMCAAENDQGVKIWHHTLDNFIFS